MIEGTEIELKESTRALCLSYSRVFEQKSPYVQDVIADLAKFCRALETTFHQDARVHAVLEGRREVFLRIMEHLELNHEEIYKYHVIRTRPNQTRTTR